MSSRRPVGPITEEEEGPALPLPHTWRPAPAAQLGQPSGGGEGEQLLFSLSASFYGS